MLILATGAGFWQEMHHVLAQLLEAELSQRVPVVYWDEKSLYDTEEAANAFELFFLPVSGYSVEDLRLPSVTGSALDIAVHSFDTGMEEPMRRLKSGDPLFGLSPRDLYARMLKKYVRLQPDIVTEIRQFEQEKMRGKPVIGVHIRGSDKITEVPHLLQLNEKYPPEIDGRLQEYPAARIFLMTDCADILDEYRHRYGGRLICTDCRRVASLDAGVHYQTYADKKRKGVEVIKDTWLAARCDCFLGNGYSNVSRAVSELKRWPENGIKLFF